jgi:hypothetical protein
LSFCHSVIPPPHCNYSIAIIQIEKNILLKIKNTLKQTDQMVDITALHTLTIKAILNHQIDYSKFESVEELREELKKKQYLKFKEKYRQYYRERMAQKYKEDPQKYRQICAKNRKKMMETNPDFYRQKAKLYRDKVKVEKLRSLGILPPLEIVTNEPELLS